MWCRLDPVVQLVFSTAARRTTQWHKPTGSYTWRTDDISDNCYCSFTKQGCYFVCLGGWVLYCCYLTHSFYGFAHDLLIVIFVYRKDLGGMWVINWLFLNYTHFLFSCGRICLGKGCGKYIPSCFFFLPFNYLKFDN